MYNIYPLFYIIIIINLRPIILPICCQCSRVFFLLYYYYIIFLSVVEKKYRYIVKPKDSVNSGDELARDTRI